MVIKKKAPDGKEAVGKKLVIDILDRGILSLGDIGVLTSLLGETVSRRGKSDLRKSRCDKMVCICNAFCPPCTENSIH
jgi:hypothetical protein